MALICVILVFYSSYFISSNVLSLGKFLFWCIF